MSRRSQVITASALTVIGLAAIAANYVPLATAPLNAFTIGATSASFDFTKIFLWTGAALLVVSALLYIRASAD